MVFLIAGGTLAYEIQGRIVDARTGLPMPGVNVIIEGTNIGTYTDEEGIFTLAMVPQKSFILSAGHVGYQVEKVKIDPELIHTIDLEMKPIYLEGEEVIVTSSRAELNNAPLPFSNISTAEVREEYLSQEFPMLIEYLPGVFSYSDAGNPQGYSYLKIRGFDQKRISVMINGIPLNDPEDHQVYWVDMPDLAANVDDIQVQRGLGYSAYGPSSFGGSVNILTTPNPQSKRMELTYGYGSFNTRKMSALFNSGIVDNTYQVYGRFSRITTDGYRDNSGFEGWSYFLSATRYGLGNTLTLNLYGGPEFLHAAWDGTPEAVLDTNRTYNPIEYRNTVDNFNQPHYELIHTAELSDVINLKTTLFYIKGRGYWEIYKNGWYGEGEQLSNYGFTQDTTLFSPLVQQQWVDKHQWGVIPQLEYQSGKWKTMFGGNFNMFHSHHWGKIIWTGEPPSGSQPDHKDHDFNGDIWEASLYGHAVYEAAENLSLLADLQYRHLDIKFEQNPAGAFSGSELNYYEITHDFLNPKLGISYILWDKMTLFAGAGYAQREPSQREYWDAWVGPEDYGIDPLFAQQKTKFENGVPVKTEWSEPLIEPEKMTDIELGLRYIGDKFRGGVNLYWMNFRHEIIFGGGVSNGYPIVGNADKTLHRGIEAEVKFTPFQNLSIYGNLTYSCNTFESDDILGLDPSYIPVPIAGNVIPLFPELMSRGRVSFLIDALPYLKVKPALGLSYIGEQYLESTNMESSKIDDYWTADFRLTLEAPPMNRIPGWKLKFAVNNLFDEEYETSGYYYEGNYYYPGAERNYYAELTVGF